MNEAFCHVWVLVLTHTVAGPLVLLLVYLLRGVAGRLVSLVPGLEARSVRGPWKTKFNGGSQPFDERVEVSQFLHWVWGAIDYEAKKRRYTFAGTLRENVLVATYEFKASKSALDRGSFTLRLDDSGKTLDGKYSWLDEGPPNQVRAGPYTWTRDA